MMQQTLPSRRRANKSNLYKLSTNNVDLYRYYKDKYGTPKKGGCSRKVFSGVIDEFNRYIADRLLEGDRICLPNRMGYIQVMKFKQKYILDRNRKIKTKLLMIDWEKTWEWWKKDPIAAKDKKFTYYVNDHSDGYRYKFVWDKINTNASGIAIFSFKPSRLLSRRLASFVTQDDSIKNYTERNVKRKKR